MNFQLNGSIRPVPPPRDHLRMEKDGRMVNRAPAPQVPDRNPALQSHQIAQIVDATPEQLDSIKKYQVNLVWIHYSRFFWFQIKMQPKMLCLVLKRENCHRYFHLWSSQSVKNQRQNENIHHKLTNSLMLLMNNKNIKTVGLKCTPFNWALSSKSVFDIANHVSRVNVWQCR